jgi:hypothetical protein
MTDHVEANHSANKEGWEKDTDARRWRRFIDDRRRNINSFAIAVRPIHTPATFIVVPTASVIVTIAVIATASVIVTAAVMSYPAVTIIIAEGLRHVQTADHCG